MVINELNGYKGRCSMIGKLRTLLFYTILLVCLAFWSFNALNAFADIIVDNGDSGTFYTGTWKVSGGSDPYGVDSLWARDGATYTWQFDSQASGTYEVLMWWSEWPSRGTDISVDINYRGGIETRSINQLENAGLWNSFGTYYFDVSGSVTITAANGSTVSTCADAVWFKLISANTPPTASIDSITPNPAEPGQPVQFIGQGTDAEGSVEAYQWESSIDGSLSDLSSGFHFCISKHRLPGRLQHLEASILIDLLDLRGQCILSTHKYVPDQALLQILPHRHRCLRGRVGL
jgi:hypothetical protein